jgi:type IV pilus assembly protein PilV
MIPPLNRPRPRAAGFTMVELLVAMAILAIGLLGLASLQVATQSSGTTARERGTAALIAHNVLDRIQAEGAVTAAERFDFKEVTAGQAFTFIDPYDPESIHDSSGAENLTFDIRGRLTSEIPSAELPTSPTVFTVTWRRQAGLVASPTAAFQQFIVNVNWKEVNASGATVDKYLSVTRNVRV